jgi:YHS domain-containing protein
MRKIIFLLLLVFILTACTPANATQSQLPTNTPEINHIATQEAVVSKQVLEGLPTDKLLAEDPGVNVFSPPTFDVVQVGEISTSTIPTSLIYLEESIKSQIPGTASVEFTETTSGDYQAMFLPRDADRNMLWSFVGASNRWGAFAVYHFLDNSGTIDGVVTTGIQYQPIPFSQDAVVVWGTQPIVVKNPVTLEDGSSVFAVYFDFSSGSWAILPDLQVVDGAALVYGKVYVLNTEGDLEELPAEDADSYQVIDSVLYAFDDQDKAAFILDIESHKWVEAQPEIDQWMSEFLDTKEGWQMVQKDGVWLIESKPLTNGETIVMFEQVDGIWQTNYSDLMNHENEHHGFDIEAVNHLLVRIEEGVNENGEAIRSLNKEDLARLLEVAKDRWEERKDELGALTITTRTALLPDYYLSANGDIELTKQIDEVSSYSEDQRVEIVAAARTGVNAKDFVLVLGSKDGLVPVVFIPDSSFSMYSNDISYSDAITEFIENPDEIESKYMSMMLSIGPEVNTNTNMKYSSEGLEYYFSYVRAYEEQLQKSVGLVRQNNGAFFDDLMKSWVEDGVVLFINRVKLKSL